MEYLCWDTSEEDKAKKQRIIRFNVIMSEVKPLVAIHCLVYNHAPYLRDCLEGFVMQQTNFPFVAIVHDDASTDASAAIIREYEEKYPDIIKLNFNKI